MSLCERVMELSDDLADRLLAADACTDEGETLRHLRSAIDAAHTVKFGNECARAILASARPVTVTITDPQHNRFQPANDHTAPPPTPDPIVA